jgi:hypothetical protein
MMNRGLALAVVLVACTSNPPAGNPTPGDLVTVTQEQPGANCQYGGVAIQTGVDTNLDGTLENTEVTNTQYVCNGATVVRCAMGGPAFEGSLTLHDATDFAQLAGVQCIDGDLIIADLAGEIPALPDLQTVTGEVVIAGNNDLTSLNGLSALQNVGQSYLIQGNPLLADISELATVDNVLSVFLIGNNSLTDLAGLSTLDAITTKLVVANNPALTSLHGLENVVTASSLTFRSNNTLADLSALANLRSSTLIEISSNNALTSLALPSLEKVDVRLLINTNATLATVSLPKLATLSDGIVFSGDPVMTSVDAPALLTTGTVTFENDTLLTTIHAPSLAYVTVDLGFTNMGSLSNPQFPALTAIGGTLTVYSVQNFTSFDGFGGLESIGSLYVNQATDLPNFHGLTALQTIAGDFTLVASNKVTSFTGLDVMTDIGGNLTISENQMLSPQVAAAFAASVTVHGTTTIN